jgi:hypothetical protein
MVVGQERLTDKWLWNLHGAKDYFDCTKAVIATDGILLTDAQEVASKLKIEVLNIDSSFVPTTKKTSTQDKTFDSIWEKYIIPLQGKTLTRDNGETNEILKVNWSEIERLTSNGNKGKIKVEIFRQAINKLLADGSITRDYINQNYVGRASSGVILILSQVPFFKLTDKPTGLKYIK